jgi:hypothetical protein
MHTSPRPGLDARRSIALGLALLLGLVAVVMPAPRPVLAAVCEEDVYEDNDTLETAAVPNGNPALGRQCDDDWFQVEAFAGQDLVIDLRHFDLDNDLDLEVHDGDGLVASATAVVGLERLVVEVMTSGTHYLRIYPHDGVPNGNRYVLSIRREGSLYVPFDEPIRGFDSRTPASGLPNGFGHDEVIVFGLDIPTLPGQPSAYSVNVTVVGATSSGYLSIEPLPGAPTTSTINVPKGDTRANGTVVDTLTGITAVWMGSPGSRAHVVVDVTGAFRTGGDGSTFVPAAPTRLLDTRTGTGLDGRLPTGQVRTFGVAGLDGIPETATAVTGNLTVVDPSSGGYVSLGPVVASSPATSTVNVPRGDTRANGVLVGLSDGGDLQLVWTGAPGSSAHLLFDVTGYFVEDPDGAAFYLSGPERLLDTRAGIGLDGPSRTGIVRKLGVTEDAEPNTSFIPHEAVAALGNLTAVRPTSTGYVSLGPTMTASPSTSSLNVPAGDTRANNVAVALSENGSIELVWKGTSGSSTHLLFDATGYFR